MSIRWFGLSFVLCLVGGAWAQSPDRTPCRVAESERFVFYSDPLINLHHFLFQWARNQPEPLPEDRRRPTAILEVADLAELAAKDREAWLAALNLYRAELAPENLLFNRGLESLRNRLIAAQCGELDAAGIEPELQEALAAVMSIYRERWWSGHDTANRAWIEGQVELLSSHEKALAEGLAEAYGGAWPDEKIRVDVGFYANWAGGYTTNNPNVVTLEGRSYPGLQGLEMIFHEVSHSSFLEQALKRDLAAAFARLDRKTPQLLSHTIQFTTPSELLRARLSADDGAGFDSVGEAVLSRGRMREQYDVVLPHWRAYLAGEIGRGDALRLIAEALSR